MATTSSSSKISGAPGTASPSPDKKPRIARTRVVTPQDFGQIYSTPTFKPGLDSSVDEYKKRLADILKKVRELQPERYDDDTIEKSIGSFTVLPTYDQEGYLGGHDLDEIKEALKKRREEIQGNPVAYNLAEKKYKELSDQIENNEKEVARRERDREKQAYNWGQDRLAKFSEETEGIKNVIFNLRVERSKYFEKMRSNTGLLQKTQDALNFENKNPSSPLIPELTGQLLRHKAELRLIDSGLNSTIDSLSTTLSNGPQDTTFSKQGRTVGGGEARSLLEIATTQKAKEFNVKKNIGNEIQRRNEVIDGLSAQIKRLRSELVEKRGAVSPETLDALFRVLRVVNGSKEFSSKEMMSDVKFLKDFVSINTKEVEGLEDLFGPDISQRSSTPILRGTSHLVRLPADTQLSVEHIKMLGGNPIADLMNGISTHGKNIAVYEAWKKAWLDSGKIDTYRSEHKTKGLWESDEKEAQQISTTKEMFNLEFELLKLEDFTTEPHLTDNFAQSLISYAKILSGIHNDKGNDIEWEVKHYEHAPTLEKIKIRKVELEEARNNKNNEGLKKQKKETAPKINKDLEFLSNNDSWEMELLGIRLSAFTKRAEAERAALDIFKAEVEAEISAAARPINYNIPYILSLLEKIDKKMELAGSGKIMREMSAKWLRFSNLFSSLSDDDFKMLSEEQRETIQKFKKDEEEIPKIIFGVVSYYTTICDELRAKATTIKNRMGQDLNTRLAKSKNVLSAISAANEDINLETLATYGITDNDAQELIETLKKAGILK